MRWLRRLLGADEPPPEPQQRPGDRPSDPAPAAAGAPTAATAAAGAGAGNLASMAASGLPFSCWLIGAPAPQVPADAALLAAEQQALAVLSPLLTRPTLPPELLPRAANVVPQLIAMLRQDDLPVSALAERVAKDPNVAAEVLRMARSAYYRNQGPLHDLPQAIQRLGVHGLQMAIGRVVLRPMYQAGGGTQTADVMARLWDHIELLSQRCAQRGPENGVTMFDGLLVGLLHDTGWSALFQALHRGGVPPLTGFSIEGAEAFADIAHGLFGRAAQGWQLTPAFDDFAADAATTPLAQSRDPLALLLRTVQPVVLAELSAAQG